ncbi:MAG: ABC transporter ATP-binding protein [Bacillota bacterium]
MNNFAIELKNITKTFGSVVANKNVNLNVKQGEILALLGENGSGKTTLMNMLSGIYQPDSGSIYVKGKKVSITCPEDSKKLKIGMVHQHFKLVDVFCAADNIWMGAETKDENNAGGIIGKGFRKLKNSILPRDRHERIAKISEQFGFELNFRKKIYDMAVSEKQTVEIVKVLYYGAELLILDEPTAVLTVQEIDKLFAVLRKMKEAGKAIIIITHKLNEVMSISDRVAILRKGEYITTVDTAKTSEKELTEYMVGRKIDLFINREQTDFDKPLLEIKNLSIKKDDGSKAVDDVSFYIRGGEMLGVAGIAGCGQKELCEAISGLRKVSSGMIAHKGESILSLSPKTIIEKGISMSFIPEDRLGMGLAPSLSITDNMILKTYKGKSWSPFVDRKYARKQANKVIADLGVVTPSSETPVRRMSGGNVQKVLVGREIMADPNVIVTAYPVRGLDINSSYAIYDILNEQKKNGVGILFVGEDLDVMMALCDKIMVLCHGKIMGIVHADKITKEELGLMMTGSLNMKESKKDKVYGIAKDSAIQEYSEEVAENE